MDVSDASLFYFAANVSEKLVGIKHDPSKRVDKDLVPCYDPATMQLLGHMPAMSANEVRNAGRLCSAPNAASGSR